MTVQSNPLVSMVGARRRRGRLSLFSAVCAALVVVIVAAGAGTGAYAAPVDAAPARIAASTASSAAAASTDIPVHPWFEPTYTELGGTGGVLGAPLHPMQCQSSSCWQEFAGGVLTSDGTRIVKLSTEYVSTWLAAGGPDGGLGLVAGPESCFGTYCATPFTHGVARWTPGVGVQVILVHPWFEEAWKRLGAVTGEIGIPLNGLTCQSSSCWQEFVGGVLTSDGTQIVKLSSSYVRTWLAWGGPDGDIGLVSGPEKCYGWYCEASFTGGVIVWNPGGYGVTFPVTKRWFYGDWIARGGGGGSLGVPLGAMECQRAACYQQFSRGTLTSSSTGIVSLSTAYVDHWLYREGGPDGHLGLVEGPESCFSGQCQVPFQHGLMVWQPGGGVRVLTGAEADAWRASYPLPGSAPSTGGSSGGGTPANPGDTVNCDDFDTQAQAQAWFDKYKPYYGDVARLDRDNNGIACESRP